MSIHKYDDITDREILEAARQADFAYETDREIEILARAICMLNTEPEIFDRLAELFFLSYDNMWKVVTLEMPEIWNRGVHIDIPEVDSEPDYSGYGITDIDRLGFWALDFFTTHRNQLQRTENPWRAFRTIITRNLDEGQEIPGTNWRKAGDQLVCSA